MKIMIINHYAGSDTYGMEFRPLYFGRELIKLGHEVTVIAADHSHLRIKNPIIEQSFTEEIIDGVRFVFVKTPKYHRNDLNRLLNIASFLRQVKQSSLMLYEKYKPDVIIASSTYPYDIKAAQKIARFDPKIKVCFEVHDIWPMSLIEIYHLNENNLAMKNIAKAEEYAFKTADTVISILPHVDRHIKELGIENVNYAYIPNGVIIDEGAQMQPPVETAAQIEVIRSHGKFILMYLGGFSKANALDDLMQSAQYLDDDTHIVMIGKGPLKDLYQQEIEQRGIRNVSILPPVKKTQVTKVLMLSDCLYIGAKNTKLYDYGVGMNKIFDYMLSKRPIIYGIKSSNNSIEDAQCGVTITPECPKEIAAAARKIFALTQEQRNQMGENGYQYVVENHDYTKLAQLLIEAVKA